MDMSVQLKIVADAKKASQDVALIREALGEAGFASEDFLDQLEKLENTLGDTGDTAKTTGDDLDGLGNKTEEAGNKADTATSKFQQFVSGLDELEKKVKKAGRDMTGAITAPLAAIAALSFKNLYDDGALLGSTGPAREFALVIQGLQKNFKEMTLMIAQELAPAFTKIVGAINTGIQAFKSMDKETRMMIYTIAGIAAVLGPAMLAFSTFASMIVNLTPVFVALGKAAGATFAAITAPITLTVGAVAAVGVAIAGLINLFLDLKKSGVGTVDAIGKAFLYLGSGILDKVVGNVYRLMQALLEGYVKFSNFLGLPATVAKSAADSLGAMRKTFSDNFKSISNDIDKDLKKIGTTAGESFTLGLSKKIQDAKNFLSNAFSNVSTGGLNTAEQDQAAKDAEEKQKQEMEDYIAWTKEHSAMLKAQRDEMAAHSLAIKDSIAGGMTDALFEFADGTKSAGQAFADFAKGMVTNLSKMITQALIFRALFPEGSAMGNLISGFSGAVKGFATGGPVIGAGTGTSDSIPAWLSNGEYVMDAKSVQHFGMDYFRNLQRIAKGGVPMTPSSKVARFANGGPVTSSSQAPQVVIQNTGTGKNVASTEYDPKTAVTTIILEDLGRNGPVSKSIQNTFGMRRGGAV